MKEKELIKLAFEVLSIYTPSAKNDGAYFITRANLLQILPENIERKYVLKILKIAKFQESAKKINKRKQRGYFVKTTTISPDLSKLSLPSKEQILHDQTVQRHYVAGQDREIQALKYITDNWYMIKQFMPDDIILAYNSDPTFKNASAYKKRRAIEHAGFVESYTMFEENRDIPKRRPEKNAERQTSIDLNKLLGRS